MTTLPDSVSPTEIGHTAAQNRVSVVVCAPRRTADVDRLALAVPDFIDEVVVVHGGELEDGEPSPLRRGTPVQHVAVPGGDPGALALAGARASAGEIIVVADGDGRHPLSELPMLVGALLGGADFAEGSRFMQGGGGDGLTTLQRARATALRLAVRLLCRVRISDPEYRYVAFWRRSLPALSLDDPEHLTSPFALKLRARRGRLAVVEVPSYEAQPAGDPVGLAGIAALLRGLWNERDAATGPGRPA